MMDVQYVKYSRAEVNARAPFSNRRSQPFVPRFAPAPPSRASISLPNMPKRKRESDAETEDVRPSAHQQRVQYKLKQSTVKLGHAFKVAKGFERQKLGRRRQTALTENENMTVKRIDAEIGALKVRGRQA